MPGQVEIGNDLGIEQRDGISRHGVAEPGVKLLGHGRPANDRQPLQNGHLQPRFGEIGGADQAVMAAADDYDVTHWRVLSCQGRRIAVPLVMPPSIASSVPVT